MKDVEKFFSQSLRFFGVDFKKLSVVGDKSVGFVLHVAELGKDCSAKSFLYCGDNLLFIKGNEGGFKFLCVLEKLIAVGFG